MRSASKVDIGFPYTASGICWMTVKDGVIEQTRGIIDRRETVRQAQRGECQLLAVWPGQYKADLFQIDDLAEAATALGVK